MDAPPCFLTPRKAKTNMGPLLQPQQKGNVFNTSISKLVHRKSKKPGLQLSVHFPPPNLKCRDLLGEVRSPVEPRIQGTMRQAAFRFQGSSIQWGTLGWWWGQGFRKEMWEAIWTSATFTPCTVRREVQETEQQWLTNGGVSEAGGELSWAESKWALSQASVPWEAAGKQLPPQGWERKERRVLQLEGKEDGCFCYRFHFLYCWIN